MEFEDFLISWSRDVESLARQFEGNGVAFEDLKQEASILLWELWDRYRNLPRAEIEKIVRASLPRRFKRVVFGRKPRLKELQILDEPLPDGEGTIGDLFIGLQDIDAIFPDADQRGLSRREQEVLVLRGLFGLSIEDTAEELGISPNTVREHWQKARLKLQERV